MYIQKSKTIVLYKIGLVKFYYRSYITIISSPSSSWACIFNSSAVFVMLLALSTTSASMLEHLIPYFPSISTTKLVRFCPEKIIYFKDI